MLGSIGLHNVGIDLRDGPFSTDYEIVNLHSTKVTHWDCYMSDNYFESCACSLRQKLSKFFIIRNGVCFYSEYQIRKKDCFCASYCLNINYLTKIIGIVFRYAVLKLYYQMIQ